MKNIKPILQNYSSLFFDLDGTLTDSGPGIINSVKYALNYYGIEEKDQEKLKLFIGPPLVDSFMELYGFSNEKAHEAMAKYREYFSVKGILENSVYNGIYDLLQKLKDSGKKLYIATGKPEIYLTRILKIFDLEKYFIFAGGSDLEETRSQKYQIIDYVIKSSNLEMEAREQKILMVGDRKHDIIGAKKNSIHSCGVLWGYGSEEELKENGADYIVKNPSDLL